VAQSHSRKALPPVEAVDIEQAAKGLGFRLYNGFLGFRIEGLGCGRRI
jgi:hypothetical protein